MAVVSRLLGPSPCSKTFLPKRGRLLRTVRRAVRYVGQNGSRENRCWARASHRGGRRKRRYPAAILSAFAVQQLNRVRQHRSRPDSHRRRFGSVNSLEIDPNRYPQILLLRVFIARQSTIRHWAPCYRGGAAEISANRQLQKGLGRDFTRVRL